MKIDIEYEVTTSFRITVERNELPEDHDALLESVTRDELFKYSYRCLSNRMGAHKRCVA